MSGTAWADTQACSSDPGGITLSPGFCATVFADNIGHARHMVVAPNGVVYVNDWSGTYYPHDKPTAGGFLVALQDTKGTGHADVVKRFGDTKAQGSAGGTGIALYKGALYAEMNDKIIRYALTNGSIVPAGKPETVVSGLPLTGDHPMHPFVIDAEGNLFVDLGSATNSCQSQNRQPNIPGINPCTELETRAGVWRYDANKTGQVFSPAERYATGIRNGEGFTFDAEGHLFVTQHGRDQLSQNWAKLYKSAEGPELPAEEFVQVEKGGDYGWPECYFDGFQKKLVLAPEYGGDGGKTVGVCADKKAPAAFFPAHWAPNDALIYQGKQFPAPYQGGVFIAFHGSWNRAPAPQGGYNVVYQPMENGKAKGDFVVFADGFAGAVKDPGKAAHRPGGLAVGPDGALYISEDIRGRIWKVTYHGDPAVATVAAAPAPASAVGSASAEPPEGTHPDAGRAAVALPVPPGSTKDQVALGDRVYHGEVDGGACAGCHGSDGTGTSMAPDLTTGKFVWGDGSVKSLAKTITTGVPKPKNFTGAMPPLGGAQLTPQDVEAAAAYVWALSHAGKAKG
ncbi:MAG TPA: PQQ-dependent sugar dehydrogenase [Alphaproteobacteria bacterium]|nr:PQQ-dependent sugar dehydrogenase [Alphaproteobacteria bacterium]